MAVAVLSQQLADFPADLETELDGEELDLDAAVVLLAGLRECLRDLKLVEKTLEARVVGLAGEQRTFTVPECGTVEVNWRKNRSKYQYRDAVAHVVAYAVETPGVMYDEDGTRLPPAVAASNIARAVMDCVGASYLKKKSLERYGLDIDEYSESGPWQGTVRIVP